MKTIKNNAGREYYQLDNGSCYDVNTAVGVVEILEKYRDRETRIRVFYGDQETGRCWMEENDTMGIVGRSSGSIKIPLLIKTHRSCGGGAILTHRIVKIQIGRCVMYQHPDYHQPEMRVAGQANHSWDVLCDGGVHANFKSLQQAERYMAFMRGERNSK